MQPISFYDSNILLYAISSAPEEAYKQALARRLLDEDDWGLSAQVLQEFYVNATKAKKPAMSRQAAAEFIEIIVADRPCIAIDATLVQQALVVQARYQLSYWDAAIVAAAQRAGAAFLLSEDMNHGQSYGSVQVLNPFIAGQH